jgi:D-xylose transport system substrate-binding protein
MHRTRVFFLSLACFLCFLILASTTSCKNSGASAGVGAGAGAGLKTGALRIGFSMDSLQLERWQRDRDFFVERAKELGA